EAGDDCIVLKSTKESAAKYGSCENITVTNCTLISRSSAIKIGTETNADIRDCVFNNCVIRNSNRGLGIWVRDNSIIENIIFSNMVIETRLFEGNWWGKGEPIYITAEKRIKNRKPGKIRNIKFKDIIARSESGIYLGGSEESILENITLEDIDLFIEKKSDLAGGKFDIRPVYEKKGIFESDISGIYSKNINELSLRNIKVKWDENEKQDYWSHAVYCDNIYDLELKGLKGKAAFDNLASVKMKKVKNL
ncbi:MAG: glycosyl hydrolase family 28 protein, partial [Bacillota bacterium]